MINTVLASVALLAATAVAGPGSAIVINQCSYDVHLANTPAADGGYSAINQILSSGGSYSQVYTELSNSDGWSIKLSQSDNFGSDILQYEYTYHDDGMIWYDLSEVNGNPWDGNWEITATGSCTPRQAAYRYSTDDAYGMQACADTSSITVTLCSGTSGGSGGGSAAPSYSSPAESAPAQSAPAPTSEAPAPTSEAPAPSNTNTWTHTWGVVGDKVEATVAKAKTKAPKPTTLVTSSVTAAWDGPAITITNLVYQTVTEHVTATGAPPAKRHAHHPRHPHRA